MGARRQQMIPNYGDAFESGDESDYEDWYFWNYNKRERKGPPRPRRRKYPVYSSDSDDLSNACIGLEETIPETEVSEPEKSRIEAWAEFVNFSQHTVAALGATKKKKQEMWEVEFTDAWNPYKAKLKNVTMFLILL